MALIKIEAKKEATKRYVEDRISRYIGDKSQEIAGNVACDRIPGTEIAIATREGEYKIHFTIDGDNKKTSGYFDTKTGEVYADKNSIGRGDRSEANILAALFSAIDELSANGQVASVTIVKAGKTPGYRNKTPQVDHRLPIMTSDHTIFTKVELDDWNERDWTALK